MAGSGCAAGIIPRLFCPELRLGIIGKLPADRGGPEKVTRQVEMIEVADRGKRPDLVDAARRVRDAHGLPPARQGYRIESGIGRRVVRVVGCPALGHKCAAIVRNAGGVGEGRDGPMRSPEPRLCLVTCPGYTTVARLEISAATPAASDGRLICADVPEHLGHGRQIGADEIVPEAKAGRLGWEQQPSLHRTTGSGDAGDRLRDGPAG